jgi:hypothetical protein
MLCCFTQEQNGKQRKFEGTSNSSIPGFQAQELDKSEKWQS